MTAYAKDVKKLLQDELVARYHAAFFAQNDEAALPVIGGALGFAMGLVFGGFTWAAAAGEVNINLAHLGLIGVIWVPSIVAFTYGWGVMYAMPTPEKLANERVARCASCGAVRRFDAGDPTAKCIHCDATLLVPTELASRLLLESLGRATRADTIKHDVKRRTERDARRFVGPGAAFLVLGVPVLGSIEIALAFATNVPRVSAFAFGLLMCIPPLVALPFLVRAPVLARRQYAQIKKMADTLSRRCP